MTTFMAIPALSAKEAVVTWDDVVALSAIDAVPIKFPKTEPVREPVYEPVNEPDSNEYKLEENEPVNGPSPLDANEVEI